MGLVAILVLQKVGFRKSALLKTVLIPLQSIRMVGLVVFIHIKDFHKSAQQRKIMSQMVHNFIKHDSDGAVILIFHATSQKRLF